jgi:hypothetical protein
MMQLLARARIALLLSFFFLPLSLHAENYPEPGLLPAPPANLKHISESATKDLADAKREAESRPQAEGVCVECETKGGIFKKAAKAARAAGGAAQGLEKNGYLDQMQRMQFQQAMWELNRNVKKIADSVRQGKISPQAVPKIQQELAQTFQSAAALPEPSKVDYLRGMQPGEKENKGKRSRDIAFVSQPVRAENFQDNSEASPQLVILNPTFIIASTTQPEQKSKVSVEAEARPEVQKGISAASLNSIRHELQGDRPRLTLNMVEDQSKWRQPGVPKQQETDVDAQPLQGAALQGLPVTEFQEGSELSEGTELLSPTTEAQMAPEILPEIAAESVSDPLGGEKEQERVLASPEQSGLLRLAIRPVKFSSPFANRDGSRNQIGLSPLLILLLCFGAYLLGRGIKEKK